MAAQSILVHYSGRWRGRGGQQRKVRLHAGEGAHTSSGWPSRGDVSRGATIPYRVLFEVDKFDQ